MHPLLPAVLLAPPVVSGAAVFARMLVTARRAPKRAA